MSHTIRRRPPVKSKSVLFRIVTAERDAACTKARREALEEAAKVADARMPMPDDLIEVMADAHLQAVRRLGRGGATAMKEVLSALESASYVVGRMRWEGSVLWIGSEFAGKVGWQRNGFGWQRGIEVISERGVAATEAEAKAAAESAVRKAMIGE